jgi:iron complex transport system substrate-binding protein
MRIVSLLSSATEILFALGLGDRVLAVSHECDYPPAAARLPRATRSLIDSSLPSGQIDAAVMARASSGNALYEIDVALIHQLRPDLIVTQAQCDVCAIRYADVIDLIQSDRALSATQVLALNPCSLAEILGDIERVGEATGASAAAHAYISSLRARIERITGATAALSASERPRVVCLEWLDPLMAAGNWTPELIALAGGDSGLAMPGIHSTYTEPRAVLEYDPHVLVAAPCGFDLPRTIQESQTLLGQCFWGRIAACRSERVFALDGNAYLNRSGPRVVDSMEILAHLFHPRLVAAPLWTTAGREPWARLALSDGALVAAQ